MPKPPVPCECGCGQSGPSRFMVPVRITDGPPRLRGRTLYRNAKSWQILPGCVRAFQAELRVTERLKHSVERALSLPRCWRFFLWPKFYQLKRDTLRRRLGTKRARCEARRFAWVVVLHAKRVEPGQPEGAALGAN